jgi:hypothetical protein
MHPTLSITFLGAALLGLPLVHLGAEDFPAFSDLRLEGSILPDSFDVDATANGPLGSISRDGDEDFEDAWRVGLIAASSRATRDGGFAFGSGGGIQYSQWHDGGDVKERVEALTATLRLGLVFRPAPMFHLEAMPYGALGVARGKIDDSKSDPAFYWEFGGLAGAFLTLGGGFQIGIHAGYLWNGTKLKFDDDDNFPTAVDDVEVDLRGKGAFYGISLGGRY